MRARRTRRRGRGSPPATSPARLTRRPAGGAQDEGVPLRRSAPPPPPPPAPITRTALVNCPGWFSLRDGDGDLVRSRALILVLRSAEASDGVAVGPTGLHVPVRVDGREGRRGRH